MPLLRSFPAHRFLTIIHYIDPVESDKTTSARARRSRRVTLKSGEYRAQPLRRIYIPKEDGRQRPISIPSLEDKIVQRATVKLLNAIYEQDFLECSYGFRPERSAQDALDEIGKVICRRPISFVLEADICSY